MSKAKLPKRIFIKWNDDTPDEPFLMAETDFRGLVDIGEKVKVGVYHLEKTVQLVNETQIAD